jgi:hypothetical protein
MLITPRTVWLDDDRDLLPLGAGSVALSPDGPRTDIEAAGQERAPADRSTDPLPDQGQGDTNSPAHVEPEPNQLAADAASHGPPTIDFEQLLVDRPDVLRGFYESYYGAGNDRNSTAWTERVGAASPEAYARYWYAEHGRYEGYAQGQTTAKDNVSLERILTERPDVLRGFYEAFYGPQNDRKSNAWTERVGGDTPEAYAKYWYEKHGRWEGYAQNDKAAAEAINVGRLLAERPDVFRSFFQEYYGPQNDRKSSAWLDRVGGETVEDYAKYWYVAHGQREGYTQRAPAPVESPRDLGQPQVPEAPTEAHDPSEDPWNHPSVFPDWQPPHADWQRPPDIWHGGDHSPPAGDPEPAAPEAAAGLEGAAARVSFFDPDPLGSLSDLL